jgi:prevent-host-death family protein
METVSLANAKARLSELVARAARGEPICITRRGKPMAQLNPVAQPKKPIDVDALRKLTSSMTMPTESTADFIRRMRDGARY